jgi:hypothetical protein
MKANEDILQNTKAFVHMTQSSFVSGKQFINFLDKLHPGIKKDLSLMIFAQHQIVEMSRLLPEKFYPSAKIREQFIEAAQKKLDELILKEEELAAEAQL